MAGWPLAGFRSALARTNRWRWKRGGWGRNLLKVSPQLARPQKTLTQHAQNRQIARTFLPTNVLELEARHPEPSTFSVKISVIKRERLPGPLSTRALSRTLACRVGTPADALDRLSACLQGFRDESRHGTSACAKSSGHTSEIRARVRIFGHTGMSKNDNDLLVLCHNRPQ